MSTPKRASKKTTAPKAAANAVEKVAKKVAKKENSAPGEKPAAKKTAAGKKTAARSAPPSSPKKNVPKSSAKKSAVKAPVKAGKPTPKRAARPTSFTPREVERPYGFPPDTPELPAAYGEDRFVLMTKDPNTLFAYWEITPAKKAEGEHAMRRGEQYHEALRLNWTARDIFEHNFVVLPVALTARKWYLRVPLSGLAYHAEIGWLGESGHFVSLLTSNTSDTPEDWDATSRRLKDTVAGRALLKRASRAGAPQGSSDLSSQASVAPESAARAFQGPGVQNSSPGKANSNAKAARKPVRRAAG